MARRAPQRPKLPFWHRHRLAWINALGFALTVFLALWFVLVAFNSLMPDSEPLEFPIPVTYIIVLTITQLMVVGLGAYIVIGLMWRGVDFHTHKPRLYVFFWTCAGLLYYLCLTVTWLKFGMANLPNAARWAEEVYWGSAPIGLACFALMAYVNIEIPSDDQYWDEEDNEYHYYDEDAEEEYV